MAERRGLAQMIQFPRVTGSFRAIPELTGDPDFASVTLLLDFDGVDGATDITDLSNSAHVDTFVGSAQVDTAQQFLGVNSGLFDGVGDERIHFPNDADWGIGTGDFTWECGVRFSAVATTYGFLSNFLGADGAGLRWRNSPAELQFITGGAIKKAESWSPVINTWYHVAVSRKGTSLRMFVDGVEFGTATTDSTDITQGTAQFSVGSTAIGTEPHDGNIGAVRLTKGVARFTENFTPPTVFYPTS